MRLERSVESQIVSWAESLGGQAYKFVSPGRRGAPDRILVLPDGIVMFVEVKRPKRGRRSPHQEKWIETLRALGADGFFADSLDTVKKHYSAARRRRRP